MSSIETSVEMVQCKSKRLCEFQGELQMDAQAYATLFLKSLEQISKSYNIKYSKRAFCAYERLENIFWSANFLYGSFLVDGQLKITVNSQVKPYEFDVVQFSIIEPEKPHRITDSQRVNASFAAGSLQIDSNIYYFPCNDPVDFSERAEGYVRTIFDDLLKKRTIFLTSVMKSDGGLLPYLMNHWEDIPLEAGMAYLCKGDYAGAKRCFELAEKKQRIWMKSIGKPGRYLHLIFIDYCKAMESGVEWTKALLTKS